MKAKHVKSYLLHFHIRYWFFWGVFSTLELNFSTKDPPKKVIRIRYWFFGGVFSTKTQF